MQQKLIIGLLGLALTAAATAQAHAQTNRTTQPRAGSVEQPIPGVVTVSNYEFNTFVFPAPVKRVFFPSGSPVNGAPVYLAENTQVMLQFGKVENRRPVQMMVELTTAEVLTLRVLPSNVPGVTHAVNGARPQSALNRARQANAPEAPSTRAATAPRGEDIELLKKLVTSQQPPEGFDPIRLPAPTRFDKFSVVPLAGWTDGYSRRVMVFSLVAVPGQTAVVAPPQFYRPGITAVMIDGDVVDASNSPQLFVVEEVNDE